ncbi:MAG: potassium transporter Kup [Planctomycetales bacterium]|nr:potassium transporter Kup [Planctomycetales bacterium]
MTCDSTNATTAADATSVPDVRSLGLLTLTALGVVYGDIGTSPLYALRECFRGELSVSLSEANVLGVLSLILWALILVISVKYLTLVMRADNNGEGGILALMVLAIGKRTQSGKRNGLLVMGLFGAGLLYGDGAITPAISVLSAIEGLHVATPAFDHLVLPITIAILCGLFMIQRRGTTHVGRLFGPVILMWFCLLAVLGIVQIAKHPSVLAAVSPHFAVEFFLANQWHGFVVVGIVFLVVTGGEALYADMGHFGARPIRIAWFTIVLPALLLNYFGQGALLIDSPEFIDNPFFLMAPTWAHIPLVFLAAAATVIASQAVISGAFSLSAQAVHLGYLPRLQIIHTSKDERGQVYVPVVNWLLLTAVLGCVLAFRTSEHLASAYGMAITTTMVITAVLLYIVMRKRWKWPRAWALPTVSFFLAIDLLFFGANLVKLFEGGWFPLLLGAATCLVMLVWQRGRRLVWQMLKAGTVTIEEFLEDIRTNAPLRVDVPAVYLTPNSDTIPQTLSANLRHNRVLHRPVALLTIVTEEIPWVRLEDRVEMTHLGEGVYRVVAHCGFKQRPNVVNFMQQCRLHNVDFTGEETTYFLGRLSLQIARQQRFSVWNKRLFAWMMHNSHDASAYFGIPPEQVVEMGRRLEL